MTKLFRTLMIATILVFLGACAAGTAPGVGAWDVNILTPVGAQSGVWTINADGTGIMGKLSLRIRSLLFLRPRRFRKTVKHPWILKPISAGSREFPRTIIR